MPYEDHNYSIFLDTENSGCARIHAGQDFALHNHDDCSEIIHQLKNKILHLEEKLRDMEKEMFKLKEKCEAPFSIEDIKHNDTLVELYTGLQNFQVYEFLLNKLEPKTKNLQYYKGKRSERLKPYQCVPGRTKPGRKRKTSISTEFFIALCRLRQNLSQEDLAYRFKTTDSNISTILSTWLPFLRKEFQGLIQWPTLDDVKMFYPDSFRPFKDVCSIIDCTEIFVQRPSLAEAQALTYSTYKSHNTAKYLVKFILINLIYIYITSFQVLVKT
jgi:hypothetical protein